jgi:DNA polymerase-4
MARVRACWRPQGRWILHVDLDQFLVAVELLRRPELRGLPVVVGGSSDPTEARKVVTSASYEARAYGVHAGMPLRTAARRCPDAVFVEQDKPAYDAASAEVMDVLRTFPVVVEVWGWDEAALAADTDDPEALAGEIREAVFAATGLSCSIGIGDNKLRAKTATGFAKPAGIHRLTAETWMEVMGDRPPEAIVGIGRRTAAKLGELGITSVRGLATADVDAMRARFGPRMGPWYVLMGRGVGSTEVSAEPWIRRSLSHQTTFPRDLRGREDVERAVVVLAEHVARDVVAEDRVVAKVAIVVRYSSFFTQSRVTKLAEPTQEADPIIAAATSLLDRIDVDRAIRLLGVRADLVPPPVSR